MAKKPHPISTEENEKFQTFLFEMTDVLEHLVEQANVAGYRLDYSLDSLAELEKFWQAFGESTVDGSEANRAARYLGEVFRLQLGGKWGLCNKGPRYMYDKLPVISGYARMDIQFCPIEVFANFARKREAGMLLRAVESHKEFLL